MSSLADFQARGGVAMYLCTTNPDAFALYASEGFSELIGDGMRYLAPGHEVFWFAHSTSIDNPFPTRKDASGPQEGARQRPR